MPLLLGYATFQTTGEQDRRGERRPPQTHPRHVVYQRGPTVDGYAAVAAPI